MKLKQKAVIIFSMLFTILFILCGAPVFAEEAIPSITVDVMLRSDGSAVITEIWEVREVTDGTEYYKALSNMEEVSVHSLLV